MIYAFYLIKVTFECIYPTTFSLISDPYDVIKVDISGKMSAYGNLNDGFSMTLSGGTDGTPVKLGQLQQVKATWSVTSLPDVNFFFQSCSISHDDKKVKGTCYNNLSIKYLRNHKQNLKIRFFIYFFCLNKV